MAQPYVGEIRMFAGNFPPVGWMFCEGQALLISQYETLFQLIGTTYGGDGQVTFNLPDLRGRIPIHQSISHQLAESGGAESVTLTVSQIPVHNHAFAASTGLGTSSVPQGNVVGEQTSINLYIDDVPSVTLNASAVGAAGGNQPHQNMQPFLCINYIISQFGIFPSPT